MKRRSPESVCSVFPAGVMTHRRLSARGATAQRGGRKAARRRLRNKAGARV